jgi:tetratricopeptide (TPR) repeat protein
MSHDDDLATSCVCGCTTIIRRNGYHICTLDDAAKLGQVAGELCRVSAKYPRVNARNTLFLFLLLITTAGTFAAMEHESGKDREAQRLVNLGHDFEKADNWRGADIAFSKALAVRPSAVVHLFRGCVRMNLRDYAGAVEDCESAVKLEPSNEAATSTLDTARRYVRDATRP